MADEDADQFGCAEVDPRRVERGGRLARGGAGASRSTDAQPRVAVGGDRVDVGAAVAVDRAQDQRRQQLGAVARDAQRVGDALGVEELRRAEEVALVGRGLTTVGEQLGAGGSSQDVRRRGAEVVRVDGPDLEVEGPAAALVMVLEGLDVMPPEAPDRPLRGLVEGGDLP